MNQIDPVAEIFSQGDEIVSGQTLDSNAAWLSEQLIRIGFQVTRHTAVGDDLDALVALLKEISVRADCCICSGGLGPTRDDLTTDAVAKAFERDLINDLDAIVQIEAQFRRWKREMPLVNLKQALLPDGANRIDNRWGTAPGFSLRANRCHFAFLPGVPFEMKNMFASFVQPELARLWPIRARPMVTLRCVGIGESAIQERLRTVEFPDEVRLSFRAASLDVQVKLLFPPETPREQIESLAGQVADAIGSPVFGIDGLEGDCGDLAAVVGAELLQDNHTLALLETVSSGKIAARCEGASWFQESRVIRDSQRVFEQFNLPCPSRFDPEALREAVSALALAMAQCCRVDFALAQLWNFDEQALKQFESVIAVHTALATPHGIHWHCADIGGSAARKQTMAATQALDLLRRYLQRKLEKPVLDS